MIKLLIVDDDADKAERVAGVVQDIVGEAHSSISRVESFTQACQALEEDAFDVLVLDVMLPRYDGDSAEATLGIDLLRRIGDRSPRLIPPRYIVGLTAYPEMNAEFGDLFTDESWQLLQFEQGSDVWASRLAKVLVHAVGIAESDARHAGGYDLGIVTALSGCEMEAVLQLDAGWQKETFKGEGTLYHKGMFESDGQKISVVAATAARMGMTASGALTMLMAHRYQPKVIAMVGIAAGVKGEFGDILVADQSWDYGSGKSIQEENGDVRFEPAPEPISIDYALRCQLAYFCTLKDVLHRIRNGWNGDAPSVLSAKIGPVASGAAVLENRWEVERILENNRKAIGVEMETFGVFLAASLCREPRPLVMSMKSICDFADTNKDDKFQRYASYTSAQFLHEFAFEYFGNVATSI